MLELEPAGADAELGAALRHDVEGGDGLRQKCRVAIRVAGDECAESDGAGVLGERGEQRVALDHVVARVAEHRQLVEVVHHEHRVEPGSFGGDGLCGHHIEQLGRTDAGMGEVGDLVADAGHGSLLGEVRIVRRCMS